MTRSLLTLLLLALPAAAAEPVSIAVLPKPTGTGAVVTLGQAAKLTGGPAGAREKMARLELVERADAESISRKMIRYRLRLAGFEDADFAFADPAAAVPNGGLLNPEAVEEAARQELIRRLGLTAEEVFVDVVKPVVVKLPETTPADVVELTAVPVSGGTKLGRAQVDVTIKVNGTRKLTLPVFLNATAATGVGPAKAEKATDEVLVKAKQRVLLTARLGDLRITADAIATQDGKLGQPVKVENTDSKKVVTATVSGPGRVEIDLGDNR